MSYSLASSFVDSLPKNPDTLEKHGYVRCDEATTDSSRWVWFRKRRTTFDGRYIFDVAIRYELSIGDALGAAYGENCEYTCNDVEVTFSQTQNDGTASKDEERAIELARFQIYPSSLRGLEKFITTLCP
jgi:hypothetical protein